MSSEIPWQRPTLVQLTASSDGRAKDPGEAEEFTPGGDPTNPDFGVDVS